MRRRRQGEILQLSCPAIPAQSRPMLFHDDPGGAVDVRGRTVKLTNPL